MIVIMLCHSMTAKVPPRDLIVRWCLHASQLLFRGILVTSNNMTIEEAFEKFPNKCAQKQCRFARSHRHEGGWVKLAPKIIRVVLGGV